MALRLGTRLSASVLEDWQSKFFNRQRYSPLVHSRLLPSEKPRWCSGDAEILDFSSDNAMKNNLGNVRHFHLVLKLKGGKGKTGARFGGAQGKGW